MNGGVSSFFSFMLQPNLKTQTARTELFVNSDVDAHVTIYIYIYIDICMYRYRGWSLYIICVRHSLGIISSVHLTMGHLKSMLFVPFWSQGMQWHPRSAMAQKKGTFKHPFMKCEKDSKCYMSNLFMKFSNKGVLSFLDASPVPAHSHRQGLRCIPFSCGAPAQQYNIVSQLFLPRVFHWLLQWFQCCSSPHRLLVVVRHWKPPWPSTRGITTWIRSPLTFSHQKHSLMIRWQLNISFNISTWSTANARSKIWSILWWVGPADSSCQPLNPSKPIGSAGTNN